MKGCRPLTQEETNRVLKSFKGRASTRNRCAFVLQLTTGVRVSELLSLDRGDVLSEQGEIPDEVLFRRQNVKNQESSLRKRLTPLAKEAIDAWLTDQQHMPFGLFLCDHPLFSTTTGRRLSRQQLYYAYRRAYKAAGLNLQSLGTHTPRKTWANRLYEDYLARMQSGENIDPLRAVSKMLGHSSIDSTEAYLAFREEQAMASLPAVEKGLSL